MVTLLQLKNIYRSRPSSSHHPPSYTQGNWGPEMKRDLLKSQSQVRGGAETRSRGGNLHSSRGSLPTTGYLRAGPNLLHLPTLHPWYHSAHQASLTQGERNLLHLTYAFLHLSPFPSLRYMGPSRKYIPLGFPQLPPLLRNLLPLGLGHETTALPWTWPATGRLGSTGLSWNVQRKWSSSPREWAGDTGTDSQVHGPTEFYVWYTQDFPGHKSPTFQNAQAPELAPLCYQQSTWARGAWFLRPPDDPRAPTPVIKRQVLKKSKKPCTGLSTKVPGQYGEA